MRSENLRLPTLHNARKPSFKWNLPVRTLLCAWVSCQVFPYPNMWASTVKSFSKMQSWRSGLTAPLCDCVALPGPCSCEQEDRCPAPLPEKALRRGSKDSYWFCSILSFILSLISCNVNLRRNCADASCELGGFQSNSLMMTGVQRPRRPCMAHTCTRHGRLANAWAQRVKRLQTAPF